MKKILYFTNLPAPYKVEFFNHLSKLVDLTVIFEMNTDGFRENEWLFRENREFNHIFLGNNKIVNYRAAFKKILEMIYLNKYDAIVISTYATRLQKKLIRHFKYNKIDFVISSDGGYPKNDFFIKKIVKRFYLSGAKYYFSPSEVTDNYLRTYGAKNKIYRYHFTSISKSDILKYDSIKKDKQQLRTLLGIKEDKVVVGVGSIIYRKGWDILLNSISSNDIGYYIIGGKPTTEYIKIMNEKNLKNVHFIDFLDKSNVFKYFKSADIFCLPTREDIWGLVINEAMANGLPIVTTNMCVAALALVENDINGTIINISSPNISEELDSAIKKILYSNEYDKYCQNSLKKISTYTIENMAYEYAKVFEEN